jgi:DNA-binding MarR family transcriptional regulator
MKPLAGKSNLRGRREGVLAAGARDCDFPRTADGCAGLLLEALPHLMSSLREMLEETDNLELTVPQFRTLLFVHRHKKANLSDAASHLGLTLPSTSKMVDHLVRREILGRESDETDRRKIVIRLTERGDAMLRGAHRLVRRRLTGLLEEMGKQEIATLHRTLGLLQASLPPWPPSRAVVRTEES